jgi:hypothetical protein
VKETVKESRKIIKARNFAREAVKSFFQPDGFLKGKFFSSFACKRDIPAICIWSSPNKSGDVPNRRKLECLSLALPCR